LLKLAREGKFDIIVQGCNCFCTMGSGIARQIREEYPEAYAADCETKSGDKAKLGDYTFAKTKDGFVIINAYTQYSFNRAGESDDVFEYDAFELVLANLLYEAGDANFGFPYIGMGLAGGDKTRIIKMLEDFAQKVSDQRGTVTLVEFQP
jgi:O-acetyl-ADP-ribose deacetylase (regulator of RNase III)